MNHGAITSSIDVAQVVLYLFWFFFFGLVYYLRREDKREGYPLEDPAAAAGTLREGFPARPQPKTFILPHGGTRVRPDHWVPGADTPLNVSPLALWPGAPLQPTGNLLLAGVGPGSWSKRPDTPDLTIDGQPKIVPLRVDADYAIDSRDPDPRGKDVVGADGAVGGRVSDVWVDRSERIFRYLEVEVPSGRHVLLPVNFSRIGRSGKVMVRSINGAHFADVPGLSHPDSVTLLEEEKITAYYGAGTLYANASRLGPVL